MPGRASGGRGPGTGSSFGYRWDWLSVPLNGWSEAIQWAAGGGHFDGLKDGRVEGDSLGCPDGCLLGHTLGCWDGVEKGSSDGLHRG